jgi:hypothetical protein
MPTIEEAIQAQPRNIEQDYGHSSDELAAIVVESGLTNHSDAVVHRVRVAAVAEIDQELESWLRAAYHAAG